MHYNFEQMQAHSEMLQLICSWRQQANDLAAHSLAWKGSVTFQCQHG